ncbi:hypothetical protein IPL68_05410 [Candidatus Saccharibacteria bacterium]|nr:MAG: hypothetical protein IPL68_05410 [Candidatus Saccharibacteria bacterium]
MKTRQYLHEDLAQIRRYFPGARAVTLKTPFDVTIAPRLTPRRILVVPQWREITNPWVSLLGRQ